MEHNKGKQSFPGKGKCHKVTDYVENTVMGQRGVGVLVCWCQCAPLCVSACACCLGVHFPFFRVCGMKQNDKKKKMKCAQCVFLAVFQVLKGGERKGEQLFLVQGV